MKSIDDLNYGDRIYVTEGKFKGQYGVYDDDDDEEDKIIVYLDGATNYTLLRRSRVKAVKSGFKKQIQEEIETRAYYAGIRTGIEMCFQGFGQGIPVAEAFRLIDVLEKGALGK